MTALNHTKGRRPRKADMTPEEWQTELARQRQHRARWIAKAKATDPEAYAEQQREKGRRKREKNRDKYNAYRRKWAKANPEKVREAGRRYSASKRAIVKHWPAFGELRTSALMQNELYAAAAKATPRGLPDFIRDDVIADIVLAVLDARIRSGDIAQRAKEFVKAHYREFGGYDTVSLDAFIPGTDIRRIDMLTYEDGK